MFAISDQVLDLCRSVGHEATVFAVLADGLRNGPGDPALPHDAVAGDLGAPHPHLKAWRDASRAFGTKPQRTPSAVFLLEGLDIDLRPAADMLAGLLDAPVGAASVSIGRLA